MRAARGDAQALAAVDVATAATPFPGEDCLSIRWMSPVSFPGSYRRLMFGPGIDRNYRFHSNYSTSASASSSPSPELS